MKIFITGTYRSGTTLLAQVINMSPSINVVYDAVHFMRFGYLKYGVGALSREIALQLGADFSDRLIERFGKGIDLSMYAESVDELEDINYQALYDIIMKLYAGSVNWGEKAVLEWRSAKDILGFYNDMYFIHIIRDPRDVICSWQRMTHAPGCDYLDSIANCYDSMKYAIMQRQQFEQRYVVVLYEEMVREPEMTIKQICKQVGIEFDQRMLDTGLFKNKTTGRIWNSGTSFDEKKINGISTVPIGRWKDNLAKEDVLLCELVNAELMNIFGYELSDAKPSIKLTYEALSKLQRSPLAYSGVLEIIHHGKGVMRYPLSPADSTTWETNPDRL